MYKSIITKTKLINGILAVLLCMILGGLSCSSVNLGKYSGLADKVKSVAGNSDGEGSSSEGSVIDNMAASGEVKDYGMTSDAHSKYAGKIVFSPKFINFRDENEKSFTNKFMYKGFEYDHVYFMAYFPRSFHNQAVKDGVKPSTGKSKMIFSFSVNGKKIDKTAELDFNGKNFKEWTGYSAGPINIIGSEPYQKLFSENIRPILTEYENKIMFGISFKTKISGGKMWSPAKPVAVGEFIAVIDKNMKGKLMPKSGMKLSKSLEQNIKKAINNRDGDVLRIVAPEPDWQIVRNELTGIPVKRLLRVAAAIHLKSGEYMVFFYYVSQQYNGSNYSSAVYYDSVATDEYNIDKKDIYK